MESRGVDSRAHVWVCAERVIGSEKLKNFSTTRRRTGFEGAAVGLIEIHLNQRYEKQKRWWTKEGVILDNTLIEEKVTRSDEVMRVVDDLHIFLFKQSCESNVSCVLSALGLDDPYRYPRRLYESLKNRISSFVVDEATHGVIDRGIKSLAVVVDVEIVMVEEVDDEDLVVVVTSRRRGGKGKGKAVIRRVYEKERLILEKEENKECCCGFCKKGFDEEEEEEKVVRVPCSHVLHVECLARQMKVTYICPVPGCGEVIG
ncbi:zinc finger protein [Macleaya cordata]|uniref:Zinc finger protein n=1 Tax=Macleaya cordata TaxID=56857 RepID=A0A200QGT2_MACCD|nr:zinc finger protein [Macleaya cordata]